jgi:rubrerythrin
MSTDANTEQDFSGYCEHGQPLYRNTDAGPQASEDCESCQAGPGPTPAATLRDQVVYGPGKADHFDPSWLPKFFASLRELHPQALADALAHMVTEHAKRYVAAPEPAQPLRCSVCGEPIHRAVWECPDCPGRQMYAHDSAGATMTCDSGDHHIRPAGA